MRDHPSPGFALRSHPLPQGERETSSHSPGNLHEPRLPDPASGQRPRGRHALWRGRDVVRADLQGDASRQLRARRTAPDRRLGVLGVAHQIWRAVLGRHAAHAGLHVRLRHRDPGRDPASDDRRADHLGDHGDDRAVDGVRRGAQVDLRRQSAAISARVRKRTR